MKAITAFILSFLLSVSALAQTTHHTQYGQPLYVVNGVIAAQGSMGHLNPKNVKTITVLKGKAATDLYGEKAANGVILIFTKDYTYKPKHKPGINSFASLEQAYIATQ